LLSVGADGDKLQAGHSAAHASSASVLRLFMGASLECFLTHARGNPLDSQSTSRDRSRQLVRMAAEHPGPPRTRLTSWKEIAAHLGRDVRTVLRWHKDRGLPVHRVPGGKGRNVFAYADELDAWLEGSTEAATPTPDDAPAARPRRTRLWLGAVALVVVTTGFTAGLALTRTRQTPVATLAAAGDAVNALDAGGRQRWSYRVPGAARVVLSAPRGPVFADLDGNDEPEIVASVTASGTDGSSRETLYCFSQDGRVRWTRTLDDRLTFVSGVYGPPWTTGDLRVVRLEGRSRIVWATHHDVWWPSILVVLTEAGATEGRLVHAGWITRVEASADGRSVLAAGVSNRRDAAVLYALDSRDLNGAVPEPDSSPYRCVGCAVAHVPRAFVFPRSEANRAADQLPLREAIEVGADGSVLVRVTQQTGVPSDAIFEFSPALDLQRATFSDLYWDWHRRLESSGTLHHPADACPERTPAVSAVSPPS